MSVPTFDIFHGSLNNGALWIESADGLTSAVELMNESARKRPGVYFVFDLHHQEILATVDSSRKPMVPEPPPW